MKAWPNLLRDPTQNRYLWIITSSHDPLRIGAHALRKFRARCRLFRSDQRGRRHHLANRLDLSALRTAASALHDLTVWCGYLRSALLALLIIAGFAYSAYRRDLATARAALKQGRDVSAPVFATSDKATLLLSAIAAAGHTLRSAPPC